MKVIYKKGKRINSEQLLDLYVSVGEAKPSKKKNSGKPILEIYKNSDEVISAWKGKELVGIVRILTDKVFNGFILGLFIKKEYQRKGIGKNLVKKCFKAYPKIIWYLGTNKENINFYKKCGLTLDKDPWFKKLK